METPASSPSQAFATPTPPLPPSRRKFWLSIVLALLFLVGVGYYYIFYIKTTPVQTIQTPTSTSSSQSASVNSANWKTYQSSKWAVSFRYPETWSLNEASADQVTVKSDSQITPDQFSWMVSGSGTGFCEGEVIKSTSTVDLGHGIIGNRTDCADPTSGVIGDIVIQYSAGKAGNFIILIHYKSYQGKQILEEVIKSFTPTPA